jgi:hypothetical protein
MNRQIEHYRPFLNSAPTTNSALCRLTTSTYTNSVVSGSGDDFTLDPYRPRLEIDYVQGVEVSRRYAVIKAGERRDIRCPNPGAAWNDGANLVTITYPRTNSFYQGQPNKILNPDGTVQLFTYTTAEVLPGTFAAVCDKMVVLTGAPNGSTNNIVRGTKQETWMDRAGRILLSLITDVPSSLVTGRETYALRFSGPTHQHGVSGWHEYGAELQLLRDCIAD